MPVWFTKLAALAMLIAASPLMLLGAMLVYIDVGRPMLFRQPRGGKGRRPFDMIKFRTMKNAAGPDGKPLPDAERTSAIGAFIRRTRIDELPELFTVIRGEMALVGPRPLELWVTADLGAEADERALVAPGLTGWAQVNGNTLLSREEKISLDLWYVRNRSFWLDIVILFKTAMVVVFGEKRNLANLERAYASGPGRSS